MSATEINTAYRRKFYGNVGREATHNARGTPRKNGRHAALAGLDSRSAAYHTAYSRIWRAKNGRPAII